MRVLAPEWSWWSDEERELVAMRLNTAIGLLGGRFLIRVELRVRELTILEAIHYTLAEFERAQPLGDDEILSPNAMFLVRFAQSTTPDQDGLFQRPFLHDSHNAFEYDTVDVDDEASIDMESLFGNDV